MVCTGSPQTDPLCCRRFQLGTAEGQLQYLQDSRSLDDRCRHGLGWRSSIPQDRCSRRRPQCGSWRFHCHTVLGRGTLPHSSVPRGRWHLRGTLTDSKVLVWLLLFLEIPEVNRTLLPGQFQSLLCDLWLTWFTLTPALSLTMGHLLTTFVQYLMKI